MKRRSVYLLIATILAILVPSPGRFVYGVTLVLELNILMLIGTLSVSLVKKMKLEEINTLIVLILIISSTILCRQIMIVFQPEIMLTLGFIVYLMPVSFFVIGYVFSNNEMQLKERLRINMVHILTFSVYALLFFLLRDIFGYGTFTFFGKNHQIFEKVIIPDNRLGFFSIFASIPGAMVLSSVLLFIHIYVRNKIAIIKRAEVKK
ncbi:MAG: hypothetical protein J5726_06145 [Treponema sp.]|nr:hypothetical protein [Treponema sp.]